MALNLTKFAVFLIKINPEVNFTVLSALYRAFAKAEPANQPYEKLISLPISEVLRKRTTSV